MEVEESVASYSNSNAESLESRSLEYVLGGKVPEFFASVWQQSCAVFSHESPWRQETPNDGGGGDDESNPWNWDALRENPVKTIVRHGFLVLTHLMEQSYATTAPNVTATQTDEFKPLLFRDQQLISAEERAQYSYMDTGTTLAIDGSCHTTNLWAAFLNGCSIVMNHVDTQSPWIAALCTDLQQSVPHAYANAYITPAQSQTVPAHADDRDVFILQVYGRKQWTVYARVPIPLPYPHEQVGKSDELPVPDDVMKGPVLIQRILSPGDVLYMPRGYVHEAQSCEDCCSFHVTIAIATHDWSLAGLLSAATQSILMQQIDLRRAVPRSIGRTGTRAADTESHRSAKQLVQSQIDHALQLLRHEFNVETIDTVLGRKYQRHNQRAAEMRERLFGLEINHAVEKQTTAISTDTILPVVGRLAAARVTFSTWLRAATAEEKANLLIQQEAARNASKSPDSAMQQSPEQQQQQQQQQRGLHVRTEIYDDIIQMIQYLKQDPSRRCELRLLPKLAAGQEAAITNGVCDLTLLSMGRRCVELGALAVHIPS